MISWEIVILISLALVVFLVVFALCRKDSVCAAVWCRPFGFFLEAKNNTVRKPKTDSV
jgi:hypothetical protein